MEIVQKRESIRTEILRQRENLSSTERTILSKRIMIHIIEWIQASDKGGGIGQSIEVVMIYLSMKSEVDTWQLIDSLFDLNKQVIAPVVDTDSGKLITRQIQNLEKDLVQHKYGMLEPSVDCPIFPPDKLQLILVPGIAFDFQGYRLGYGKGYYDRFLPSCPNAVTIGIAYQRQLVEDTYPQPWDVPVQYIITEKGLLSSE